MEIQGFGKYSGPSNPPGAQNPFGHFPRLSSPSPLPHRSPVNYSDLDATEVIRSAPLSSERNLSTRNPSRPLPGFQNHSDLPSSNKSFSGPYGPYRGQSPPLGFQNNHFVGGQHPHNEVVSRSDLPSSNKSFSSPYRGQSLPLGFQNNHFVGGQHPHSEFGSRSDLASSNKNFSSPYRGQSPPSGFQNNPFVGGQHPQSEVQHRSDLPSNSKSFSGSYRGRSPPSGFHDNLFVGSQHSHSEVQQRPFSSPMWGNQPKSINGKSTQLGTPSVLTASTPQPAHMFQNKSADGPLQKRARSPTLTSNRGPSPDRSVFSSGAHKRSPVDYTDLDAPDAMPSLPLAVERSSFSSRDSRPFAGTQEVPAVKKTKLPIVSSSVLGFQENLDSADEIERELHAKAKRLARFKDELREPVNPTIPSKKQHQSISEKPKFPENLKMDVTEDFTGGNADYEGGASSNSIIGLCSDMCPESERAERQRKGDLDHYERLDGDRNTSSESLAVKKYNRTAEREAELIRPMPILQKTMDYLLNLLDQPYGDKFLGLYNFLWDRMRAIRMDLRMQHLFNREAIAMLEQMIRLHIVAMHELCEYTKGEGFSEGFDAHLNIEQMNKTSVELFQFYDDHRKKGIHVHSEREFRGYYALLKLDKHPGYKVEPAELSLDLAKMTPEMRQSPEVIFARDVARACRTGNFIAFFRLARKSSYLQACLMHAHFSKLRTQALASLHSGLQNNQGIPMHQVAKWLGMEEEDTENLLEYYGFSVKDFEEPYMVKENAFMNADSDFPVKRSKLVERKRSRAIASDVSSPSLTDICGTEKLNEPWLKKDPVSGPPKLKSLSPVFSLNKSDGISSKFIPPVTTSEPTDEEMNDSITISSPKRNIQKPVYKTSHDEMMTQHKVQVAPVPLVLDFPKSFIESHENMVESPPKPNYSPIFRNSFGRTIRHDMDATTPMTLVTSEEKRSPRSPRSPVLASDSVMNTSFPQHVFAVNLEIEEQMCSREEEDEEEGKSDEETTDYYDEEIAVAKIKLILRLWKRRTTKKRELRERKLLAANAALSSLSLGPPIWQYEVQPGNYGTFNIDTIISERREIQERSWSLMNPSDVVATKLSEKNPDAKCLCWKMILCSQSEATPSAADSWLHSKLIPSNTADNPDLLVSYHDLAIWKKWSPSHSSNDRVCCLSVIKSCKFDDLNKEIAGTSAILFLLSENSPLEEQKNRLLDFIMSFPYGSRLPLLITSSLSKNESDSATISEELELHHIDKSRVIMSHIIFLKDQKMKNMDGFFSSERLEEGLKWLAIESPPQIVIREIKTRELVFSHLNPTLDILDEMNQAGPDCIILAFNEVLDRSMKKVAEAANANPTGWPCPEIGLIEKSCNEYLAAVLYLPSIGWSSVSRTEAVMSALNDSKLPTFKDDLSWLSTGLNNSGGIEIQKLRLENCLIEYLTETSRMMGVVVAQKKARGIIQKCTGLELHDSRFYIIPKWVQIFRSIFNLWLVNLTNVEVSSTYVLVQDDFSAPGNDLEFRVSTFLPSHIVSPSFDELVEVCYNTYELESVHMDYQEVRSLSPMSSDVPMSIDNAAILTNYDCFVTGVNTEVEMVDTMKTSPEADRLSEMLKKCDIMQNMIDKKLSIYF